MTLAAETRATTVRVPTVPDHVRLVWAGSLPRRRLDDKAAGSWDRKERLMGSTRRTPPATPARRHDAPAALVHRLVEEACNGGNLAALDAVLPPPSPTDPAAADGRAGSPLRDYLAAFRAAVPDARWTAVEQISQGSTVVTRLVVHGTFSGPLVGLAPPGRPATVTGVAISRFAQGRLVELWLQADLLGLLVQLGVLPPLGLAQALAMARVQRAGALLADTPMARHAREEARRSPDGAAG
jgi:predicted ester cyclase